MKQIIFLATVARFLLQVDAHITFAELIHEDQSFSHWQYVREWRSDHPILKNGDDTSPIQLRWPEDRRPEGWRDKGLHLDPSVEEVKFKSPDFRCNVNSVPAAETRTVKGGDKVGFWVGHRNPPENPNSSPPMIYHDGPVTAYLGAVPKGQTAKTWDGDGQSWFKIFEDYPSWYSDVREDAGRPVNYTFVRWPNLDKRNVTFHIPPSTPDGEYLLRVEHLGLHSAHNWAIGPEWYFSCAQIKVTGGGTGKPSPLVTIPGHFDRYDPILYSDVYGEFSRTNGAKTAEYWTRTPGPALWKG